MVAEQPEDVLGPPLVIVHPLRKRIQLSAGEAVDLLENLASVGVEAERRVGRNGARRRDRYLARSRT
jgi:hypothetical protein